MVIGICDDEVIIRKEVIRLCNEYKETNINDIEIINFASGEALLAYKEPIDILFLDIQMSGIDGLSTAEKIREKDENMIIIFLTGFTDFMQKGYKVKAFRYLTKPINKAEIKQTLMEAIMDITKDYKMIVDHDGKTAFIKLRDIIYVEYGSRNTVVRTKKSYYECDTTMNEWEAILNNGDFFRVHRAYIVNMAFVEEIDNEIILENGEKVSLAARQSAKFKKACKEFRRRNAR